MLCLLQYFFDERRGLLDQPIVARTGFWLSFFRFQGATTHTTGVGGVTYTISGFLPRFRHWVLPEAGMPTLPAPRFTTQVATPGSLEAGLPC
jgi:hypothetical protein